MMFILRRLHEAYHVKGKELYMCIGVLKNDFDRELEWAMRKKGIPKVLFMSVMRE